MAQEWLNCLSSVFIENRLAWKLNLEEIIDKFVKMNARKVYFLLVTINN